MVRSKLLLPTAQHSVVHLLGFCVAALRRVDAGQLVQRGEYVDMLGSKLLLPTAQHSVVQLLGFCVAALRHVDAGQLVHCGEYVDMLGSKLLLRLRKTRLYNFSASA